MMTRWLEKLAVTAFVSFAVFAATAVHADPVQVVKSFTMPLDIQGHVSSLDCQNSPGPQVTLEGNMHMEGLAVRLIFRNNINKDVHTRTEDITVDTTVISANDPIVIPKQPVHGGTGGNPFIWIQFLDNSNAELTDEIFLGRCVQGLHDANVEFGSLVSSAAIVDVLDCTNNPGPYITVDGSMSFDRGIKARFIFRNNDNPVGGPHEADAVRDVRLIGTGETISFPKQPVQGGVGGNPYISVQMVNGAGEPYGSEALLGKCVQLQPGN